MINNLLLCLLFFLSHTVIQAQSKSITGTIYELKKRKLNQTILHDFEVELSVFDLEVGYYTNINKNIFFLSYYTEFEKSKSSEFLNYKLKILINASPKQLNMIKTGVGKQYSINKKACLGIFFLLGVGWVKKHNQEFKIWFSNSNQLLERVFSEYPKENHYETGVKTTIEYFLSKRLRLGLELNFNLTLIHTKDQTHSNRTLFTLDNEIFLFNSNTIRHNNIALYSEFMNPGLFLRIIL